MEVPQYARGWRIYEFHKVIVDDQPVESALIFVADDGVFVIATNAIFEDLNGDMLDSVDELALELREEEI